MGDEVFLEPRGTKGRPQVKRERADRMIAALVIEAEKINADPLPWYDVTKLSVFGSYLSAKPVLGDLDIAVRTTPRWQPNSGGFTRAWQTFPSDCPAPKTIARDQLSIIHWPRLYVLKRLKQVGRGINIHSQHDLDSCGFEFEVIFEKPEGDVLFLK
ncbi:MAG: hypothetical protein KDE25_02785 [Novosphingobium sp.]|nr:hypothetical protein [Novosphingobium sp.]